MRPLNELSSHHMSCLSLVSTDQLNRKLIKSRILTNIIWTNWSEYLTGMPCSCVHYLCRTTDVCSINAHLHALAVWTYNNVCITCMTLVYHIYDNISSCYICMVHYYQHNGTIMFLLHEWMLFITLLIAKEPWMLFITLLIAKEPWMLFITLLIAKEPWMLFITLLIAKEPWMLFITLLIAKEPWMLFITLLIAKEPHQLSIIETTLVEAEHIIVYIPDMRLVI